MGKKAAIILVVILFLAALIVGGLFIFKGKVIPVLGKVVTIPFVEDPPAKVVRAMFKDLKKINSGRIALELDVFAKAKEVGPAGDSGSFSSSIAGIVPADLIFNLGLTTDFKIGATEEKGAGKVDLSLGFSYSGMNYGLDMEVISEKNKVYLRATRLPVIPFFDLNKFKDQWYVYDLSEVTDDLLESFKIINTNAQSPIQQYQYSQEEIEKLRNTLAQSNFLTVDERLADEKIDGVDCYHYSVKIDLEKFKEFAGKVYSESSALGTIENSNVNLNVNIDETIKQGLEGIDEFIKGWNENQTEIWVDKETNYLLKTYIKIRLEDEDTPSSDYEYVDVSGSMTTTRLNEEVSVEIPTSTKSLNELFNEIGKMTSGLSIPGLNLSTEEEEEETKDKKSEGENLSLDLAKDTDSDGLTDMEELIYGTDENNPDTDSDGFKDGEEVSNGFNPLGEGKLDTDSDGLSDTEEEQYGTDIYDADSDDDGFKDGEEVLNGYNPNGEGRLLTI